MFQIDLKKSYDRRAAADSSTEGLADFALEAAPVAALLLALIAGLGFWGSRLDQQNERIVEDVTRTEARIALQRKELASLTGRTREAIVGGQTSEIYWSDVLRMVSERTPDKIWMTQLVLVTRTVEEGQPPERLLRLDGGVLSTSSESNLTEIGQFLQTLQTDPRYRESFGEPVLGAVARGSDPLTMSFSITAPVGGSTS